MRATARDGVVVGGGPTVARAAVLLALVLLGLLAGGCRTVDSSAVPAAWTPPRGGLVTHELAADAARLAGRSDDRLGHLPRQEPIFSATRIDVRTRLSTTGSGRITDSVTRRTRTTTILGGW